MASRNSIRYISALSRAHELSQLLPRIMIRRHILPRRRQTVYHQRFSIRQPCRTKSAMRLHLPLPLRLPRRVRLFLIVRLRGLVPRHVVMPITSLLGMDSSPNSLLMTIAITASNNNSSRLTAPCRTSILNNLRPVTTPGRCTATVVTRAPAGARLRTGVQDRGLVRDPLVQSK